jgi:hypothetical protein
VGYIRFVQSEKIRILRLRLKEFAQMQILRWRVRNIYEVTNIGILPFGVLEQNIKNGRQKLRKKNFPWYLRV